MPRIARECALLLLGRSFVDSISVTLMMPFSGVRIVISWRGTASARAPLPLPDRALGQLRLLLQLRGLMPARTRAASISRRSVELLPAA
jgi:hypothetical protein